jgi:hypothetical protein
VIKKQLIKCNEENTLPYVDSVELLKSRRHECESSNLYTEMWCGRKWYDILIDSYHNWYENYSKVKSKPNVTSLFIHVVLFNDEFGWMGVGKGELKQIVYIVTAGEFNHGQRKSKNIINIPILLAKAKHDRENSHLLQQLFTEDINNLSRGEMFNILGEQYFVVALIHAIVGDLPARKSIVGMTSSVTSTLPCHFCKVFAKDFKKKRTSEQCSIHKRSKNEFISLKEKTSGDSTSEYMNVAYNIVRVSELNKWAAQINPSTVLTDLMHQKYLGDYAEHFSIIVQDIAKANKLTGSSLWKDIQLQYSSYCKLNGIHSFSRITNSKTWKGLKAYGIRRFSEFAPFLFIKMNWISNEKTLEKYHAFCRHTQIIIGLSQHSISKNELNKISKLIEEHLNFLENQDDTETSLSISLNTHLDLHWQDMIQDFGIPRGFWCFVFEGMIRDLKKYFKNTNNKQVSWSVFNRYLTDAMLLVIDEITSNIPLAHPDEPAIFDTNLLLETFHFTSNILMNPMKTGLKKVPVLQMKQGYINVKINSWIRINATNIIESNHIGFLKHFLLDEMGILYVAYYIPFGQIQKDIICNGLVSVNTFSKRMCLDMYITTMKNVLENCYIMDWSNSQYLLINQKLLS